MTDLNKLMSVFASSPILKEQQESLGSILKTRRENELTVSVIGQFKRGKSSLINAMLGEDILPTGIIPLTTVVTEIRLGQKFKAEVLFNDGKVKEISKEDLYLYCSESENKGNCKNVEMVKLSTPLHPFGSDVVLVDTPGVGSIHQHNTASSYDYVQKSDAVIFLLSVDSPVSETERDFLLNAKEYAGRFFFAVNKCDVVTESDLKTFMDFCRDVISKAMEKDVFITPVSAKTKNGIEELRSAIDKELQNSHKAILDSSAEKKAEILRKQARAKIELTLKSNLLPFEELSLKLERIEEKEEELKNFNEEVNILSAHRTKLLVEDIKTEIDKKAEDLKAETESYCEELYNKYKELSVKDFENTMQKDLNSFIKEKLEELNKEGKSLLSEGYEKIAGLLADKAAETAKFISDALKEEFQLDYPFSASDFTVSKKSDFIMHVGMSGTLLLDKDAFSLFLPRSVANKRFFEKCKEQSNEDIDFNKNNMLSDYRYKMQESLRTMCYSLTKDINDMAGEISSLIAHIKENLNSAKEEKDEKAAALKSLLELL